ncbi:riboflavin kinase [Arthrobacter sp. I2-34]|uniref:riboflavin kinase n=1 Tax=Arthrobacter hankyongi TaxID=2904801 RepID=A0ABS9LDT7_9MICC|nr:riboflavin kinase [Arthrobacter hankyongi]MCG2624726.1 riboflavin kinase [Arthrobacter hankyongi]
MKALTNANAPSGTSRLQSGATAGDPISGAIRLEGVVEHGDARGRELGFPTANIAIPEGDIRDGVWAGTVRLGPDGEGRTYAAAVSVGRRPTYYRKGTRLLEAHLLDFNGDLYGRSVQVSLHEYIRPQRRFRGTDELAAQIRDDVASVRSWATTAQAGAAGTGPNGAAADALTPESDKRLHRPTPRNHLEWSLLINAWVEIRHDGRVIRTGFVEDAMPDSTALWIAADANGPRQMFEASQGHQVWVTPQELPGDLRYRMTTKQMYEATSAPNA